MFLLKYVSITGHEEELEAERQTRAKAEWKKNIFSALLLVKCVSITGHIKEHEEELVAERQSKAKAERQRSDFQTCFY